MDFGSLQSYLVIVSCLIQPLVRVWVVDLVPEAVGQIVSCSYDGLQGISKVFFLSLHTLPPLLPFVLPSRPPLQMAPYTKKLLTVTCISSTNV